MAEFDRASWLTTVAGNEIDRPSLNNEPLKQTTQNAKAMGRRDKKSQQNSSIIQCSSWLSVIENPSNSLIERLGINTGFIGIAVCASDGFCTVIVKDIHKTYLVITVGVHFDERG